MLLGISYISLRLSEAREKPDICDAMRCHPKQWSKCQNLCTSTRSIFAFRLQHFQIHRFSGCVISTFHAGRCHVNNEDIQPLEKANNTHLLYLLPPHLSLHAAIKTFPFKPLNSPFNQARATWVGNNPGGDIMKVMKNAVF
jgi:hypothetical protein